MSDLLQKLLDILLYIPKKILELILYGLASLIEAIPVPDFIQNIPALFSQIGAYVWYFLDPFQIGTGLSIILSAYVLRFLIRRIPFIG